MKAGKWHDAAKAMLDSGMTIADIAEDLGLKYNTVYRALRRSGALDGYNFPPSRRREKTTTTDNTCAICGTQLTSRQRKYCSVCKFGAYAEIKRIYMARWHDEHKESQQEKTKAYYEAHKEEIKARVAERRRQLKSGDGKTEK